MTRLESLESTLTLPALVTTAVFEEMREGPLAPGNDHGVKPIQESLTGTYFSPTAFQLQR